MLISERNMNDSDNILIKQREDSLCEQPPTEGVRLHGCVFILIGFH
jgi:hypothetical protein